MVILDAKRAELKRKPDTDTAEDVEGLRAILFDRVSDARQRLWLAQGHKPSAPSRTSPPEETDDQ